MGKLYFDTALLPEGWADRVLIETADDGVIGSVTVDAHCPPEADRGAIGLPGLPNLHSHAFQRGMAGLAEVGSAGGDSFWTWRQVMYRFLDRLSPDDVEAIATQLYVEMLEAGFTSVAEFHYLHHAADGSWYADAAEMAGRIAAAAHETGIGLTLLPVLYAQGGFGSRPHEAQQRRFAATADSFGRLLDGARTHVRALPHAVVGVAPHSLRAVTPESLAAAVAATPAGPIHIHVAEQQREVEDCLAWSGLRPVEWLLRHQPVDARWCLIHATHMTPDETAKLARSGAIAGLCPQTEANLGDGIFDGLTYLAAGGAFGIGTDSHIRVDAAEELRTLEYGQRLRDRARNVLGASEQSTGRRLYDGALGGGAKALGRACGAIAAGYLADLVGLDPAHPLLAARHGDRALDSWLFAGDHCCVLDVWVAGRRVVADSRHPRREQIASRFVATMRRVLS